MPKRFDFEDEPNEFMEMPCMCDCGKWFDLHDGYRGKKNKVVCRECHEADNYDGPGDEYYERLEGGFRTTSEDMDRYKKLK